MLSFLALKLSELCSMISSFITFYNIFKVCRNYKFTDGTETEIEYRSGGRRRVLVRVYWFYFLFTLPNAQGIFFAVTIAPGEAQSWALMMDYNFYLILKPIFWYSLESPCRGTSKIPPQQDSLANKGKLSLHDIRRPFFIYLGLWVRRWW